MSKQVTTAPSIVVFDVGGVLIDWNPRYLYRQLFVGDSHRADAEMRYFLTHICSHTWNLLQDAGRSFADGVAELSARYPQYAELIAAYDTRWEEMVCGEITDSVAILQMLKAAGTPLYAITNFSAEKFALTRARYDFFDCFNAILVSAELRLIKPDPAIYLRLLTDYGLTAADCVFIDDSWVNVYAAEQVGMQAIQFQSATQLRTELTALGLLPCV